MTGRSEDGRRADGSAEVEAPGRGGAAGPSPKRAWSKPELTELGNLRDLVRGGGGKLSSQFDSDGRKPPGLG